MAAKQKKLPQTQRKSESESVDNNQPVPFDEALRRLVKVPPKHKKPDKDKERKAE